MLDLTPAERQELEAEFEKLSPEDKALLEAASTAADQAITHMAQTLDETNHHLEQSFQRLQALDRARDRFGDNFVASRWLLTPNPELGGRTPLSVVKDQGGPDRVTAVLRGP